MTKILPGILAAFPGKYADYTWHEIEPMPAKPEPTVQPTVAPEPPTPTLPRMKISAQSISAEELIANMRQYTDELVKVPNWQELLAVENRARKEARKAARRQAKEKAA